jgi:hypothetical protein
VLSDALQAIVGFTERQFVFDVVVEPGGTLSPTDGDSPLTGTR